MKLYKKIIIAILSISLAFSLSFYDEKRIEKVNAIVLVDDVVVGAVVAVVLAYTGISLVNANKDIISDVYDNLSSYSKNVINNIQLGQKYINDGFQTMMAFTYSEITNMIHDIIDYSQDIGLDTVNETLSFNGETYSSGTSFANVPPLYLDQVLNGNQYIYNFTGLSLPHSYVAYGPILWQSTKPSSFSKLIVQDFDKTKSRTVSTSVEVIQKRQYYSGDTTGLAYADYPFIISRYSCIGDCIMKLPTTTTTGTIMEYQSLNGFIGPIQYTGYGTSAGADLINYMVENNIVPELVDSAGLMLVDGTLSLDPPIKTNEPSMGDIDVYDSNTKVLGATQLPLILLGSNLPLNGYDDLNGLGPDNVVVGDDQTTPFDDTYPDIVDHVGENDIDVVTDVGDTDLVTDTNSLADWLAGILSSIFDGIAALINGILDWLSDLFGVLQSILAYLGTMLGSLIGAITGAVTSLLTGLYNLLYSIFGSAIELFMGFFSALWKILEFLMRLFIYALQHLYDLIVLIFNELLLNIPMYLMGLAGLSSLFAVLPNPLDLLATSVLSISVYLVFLNILFQLRKKGK